MMNPLISEFDTLFNVAPFNKIKPDFFEPAINEAIKIHNLEIDSIVNLSVEPNFENTVVAIENSGKLLKKISSILYNLNAAETNREIQELTKKLSPVLTAHYNSILFNTVLFKNIKKVKEKENLVDSENQILLENTYKSFIRNGALLSDSDKKRLNEISSELSSLTVLFSENILAETNQYQFLISEISELDGLPEYLINQAKTEAEENDFKNAYLFTFNAPSFIGFMTYAKNRELRKKFYIDYSTRCFGNSKFNNEENIRKIVSLRKELAQMLGFSCYADYILENRMAKNVENVEKLLNDIYEKAMPAAEADVNMLYQEALKINYISVEPWDRLFLTERIKKKKFSINDELLKPFFQLEKVLQGVFKTAELLFDISFKENKSIAVYHKDVVAYEVLYKNKDHIAVFLADFFPRKSKKSGAWMTSYQNTALLNNKVQKPIISIVCNFSKPSNKEPSLLTFDEVKTLFHEFGHALHGILGKGKYESLTGTNVLWDFVELPSQIFENWCYEKQCLDLFAKHHITGEMIPENLIEKLKESLNFMEGFNTIRQLSFAQLDLDWHSIKSDFNKEIDLFENESTSKFNLINPVKNTCMSTAFSHIFSGGYAAGYYSYKWAEVLDADAFESFKTAGIFNKEVAKSFKENILEKGGTERPEKLYHNFKKTEPKVESLLKRAGLLNFKQ